jgi:hypothetical protein
VCDYATKKQPLATKEVNTMKAGLEVLCKQHATAGRGRFGRLTVGRMGFDLIGRATKRMAVEALHLLVSRKPHDVTAAESMKSAPTVKFDCAQFVAEACRRTEATCRLGLRMDRRSRNYGPDLTNFMGVLYGHRGTHPAVHALSAYEFTMEWELVPAIVPKAAGVRDADPALTHCTLTSAGRSKLRRAPSMRSDGLLVAGEDYTIRSGQVLPLFL